MQVAEIHHHLLLETDDEQALIVLQIHDQIWGLDDDLDRTQILLSEPMQMIGFVDSDHRHRLHR